MNICVLVWEVVAEKQGFIYRDINGFLVPSPVSPPFSP